MTGQLQRPPAGTQAAAGHASMTKEAVGGGGSLPKFQGHMPYPPEQKVDDWGLNAEQQASGGGGVGELLC